MMKAPTSLPFSLFGISFLLMASLALGAGLPTPNWYNGFSPQERGAKFKVCNQLIARGELEDASGPCMLCGDPNVKVELHSEDYGEPFLWTPPAVYTLCYSCHRFRIHTRFRFPDAWNAFLAHVRRGGYASDLKDPEIAKEFRDYKNALKRGEEFELKELRPYTAEPGTEWFAHLRMDVESLTDPTARPRYAEEQQRKAAEQAEKDAE